MKLFVLNNLIISRTVFDNLLFFWKIMNTCLNVGGTSFTRWGETMMKKANASKDPCGEEGRERP